jgi:predicted dehydrogenase
MMADGFGFEMQFTVNFERATAVYDLAAENPLKLIEPGREPQAIDAGPGMGYEHELAYYINCINTNQAPGTVTVASAAMSVKIAEAEQKSALTRRPVKVQQ